MPLMSREVGSAGGVTPSRSVPNPALLVRCELNDSSAALCLHQLAAALEAGLPPASALAAVAIQSGDGPQGAALARAARQAGDGISLSTCLGRMVGLLGEGELGLLRAGELGGFPAASLRWIAEGRERRGDLRRRRGPWVLFSHLNWAALWLSVPLAGLLISAIPSLDLTAGIPTGVRLLMLVTLPGMLITICGPAAARILVRRFGQREAWPSLEARLPVLRGPLLAQARVLFVRLLRQLLATGLPPAAAWEAAAPALPAARLRSEALSQLARVRADGRISTGFAGCGFLPSQLGVRARAAEDAGALLEELELQGELLAAEAEREAARSGPILAAWSVGLSAVLAVLVWAGFLVQYFQAVFKIADGF